MATEAPGCAFSGRDGGSLSRCGGLAAAWAAKSLVAGKFCRRCGETVDVAIFASKNSGSLP